MCIFTVAIREPLLIIAENWDMSRCFSRSCTSCDGEHVPIAAAAFLRWTALTHLFRNDVNDVCNPLQDSAFASCFADVYGDVVALVYVLFFSDQPSLTFPTGWIRVSRRWLVRMTRISIFGRKLNIFRTALMMQPANSGPSVPSPCRLQTRAMYIGLPSSSFSSQKSGWLDQKRVLPEGHRTTSWFGSSSRRALRQDASAVLFPFCRKGFP